MRMDGTRDDLTHDNNTMLIWFMALFSTSNLASRNRLHLTPPQLDSSRANP